MIRKIIATLFVLVLVTGTSLAQKKYQDHDQSTTHAFHVHQHVYVTMEDGREVEAIIHGHVSKKKYYVRQVGSNKQGKVHEKYIRAMTEEEVAAMKERRKKK